MKPLIVNARNYAKFKYDPFIDKMGKAIPRPANISYVIGQVVLIRTENALGVVLGCIGESCRELRTDMCGMVSYEDIEPATKKSFSIPNIRFVPALKQEVFGNPKKRKQAKTYRDLDYDKVVDWADKQGLNTDTPEHWKEAAQAMFEELHCKKRKKREYPELDKIVEEIREKVALDINEKILKVKSKTPYKAQYVLEELIKEFQKMV